MVCIDLGRQTALVTGGASGIGRAIGEVLSRAGAKCVILDKDVCPGGYADRAFQVDLSDPARLAACLEEVGPVDIAVNNAGVLGAPALWEAVPVGWPDLCWTVNLRAPMLVARQVLPRMRQRGHGVLINVASIAAFRGSEADPAYAATKAGLVALTKSLAAQYGRFGVRVLAVCPGTVSGTSLLERSRGRGMAREETLGLIQRLPLRRIVSAEQVAHLVAFLVSPLASALTGTSVIIDAGELSSR